MAIYTIQAGDTLTKIAKKYNTTVDKLAQENNIKNKNIILAGNTLNVSDGFQKEEIPPMLKRPDEPVKTNTTPIKTEAKPEAKPEVKDEGPSTGEVIAKTVLLPGYSTYKYTTDKEYREKYNDAAGTVATGVAVTMAPAFGIYKVATSEPVKKAAGAAVDFVKDNKETIGTVAKETVKHSLLPGYTISKIATSEPVKQAAGIVADGAKEVAKTTLGFVSWLYR